MPELPHLVEVPLRWSDMDAQGHVNNVQLVRLLEEARIAALADWLGGEDGEGRPPMVLARQEIDYLEQLRYRPRPVVVATWVSAIGGASFDMGYEVRDDASSGTVVYAAAESTQVVFDLEADRPLRLSPHDRERLRGVLDRRVSLRRRPADHR